MRKIKLDLDDLAVESFEAAETERGAGTVIGHGPGPNSGVETCECIYLYNEASYPAVGGFVCY